MDKSLLNRLKSKPFFGLLIVVILFIWITNLKSGYSLLGWDNYSSYFNLKTNLFRTLFSTWREYRGLGVPSDSEITDISRQLFFSFFTIFLDKSWLDQIYYLFSFSIGLIGMYKLASYILELFDTDKKYSRHSDIFSFLASFFYLFNLNTLSIFYFPIVMFVTRFFALPVFFYIFLRLINDKTFTRGQLGIYLALFFMASGSFLVPTVFVATCIALGILVVFQKNYLRSVFIFIIFLCLSAFWLLPFVNYTVQKSTVVRLTPTFIDGNEGFTNKNKSYYDSKKQMVFYPQFFDMKYVDSQTSQQEYFHPLAGVMNVYPNNFIVLQIFPVLYIVGALALIFKSYKHKRELLWLPGILFVFLFLSMKEYSLFGIIYSFLSKNIPVFGVIFRFADTKFHAYSAFTGSITAAFACLFLYEMFSRILNKKIILSIFSLLFVVPTLFLYKEYFTGNLIGFFMYNKIPDEYQQIAEIINSDTEDVRVMQLPTDLSNYYWKPYSWGLYSSAFLNYMLDKPFFDKTFQPASLENIYVDQKINSLQSNLQQIENDADLTSRAYEFTKLLQKLSVKYLIEDGTVTNRINSRGIDVWGSFNPVNSSILVQKALSLGLIKITKQFEIDITNYQHTYENNYPFKKAYFKDIEEENRTLTITLYEVMNPEKKISFIDSVQKIESTPLNGGNMTFDSTINTTKHGPVSIFPFSRLDNQLSISEDDIEINVPLQQIASGTYKIHTDESKNLPSKTHLIEMTARQSQAEVIISLYDRYYPTVNGREFLQKITEFNLPTRESEGKLGIRIDKTVLLLPTIIPEQETKVGGVIVRDSFFILDIIEQYATELIDPSSFEVIPNNNCYNDALADHSYSFDTKHNLLTTSSTNGSLCLQSSLSSVVEPKTTHAVLTFNVEGASEDLDGDYEYDVRSSTTKPFLKKIISSFSKPQHLRVCIKESTYDDCYNSPDLEIGGQRRFVIPTIRNIDGMFQPNLFLGLRNMQYQKQTMTLSNITLDLYEIKKSMSLSISSESPSEEVVLNNATLTLTVPKSQSASSFHYNHNENSFYYYNTPCDHYRTFRRNERGIVSYVEQCDNTFLIDLPYSNNNFYLWELGYNVGSGQQPSFILADEQNQYKNERISLYQGYPDISGFKKLQGPEVFSSYESITDTLNSLESIQAYTYVYPQPEVFDNKRKSFFVKQFTENEGLFTVNSFNVIELPNTWSTLVLEPSDNMLTYDKPTSFTYKSILPSLWKVSVPSHEQTLLLKFNEAYDKQWGIYKSLSNSLFGKETYNHFTCDGYANCFEIPSNSKQTDFYIFYWPERLSFLGWFITLGTLLAVILWRLPKNSFKSSK